MDLSHRLQCKLLACVVERGEEVYIPSGSFELRSKDTISIIATPENAIDFFKGPVS